MLSHFATVIEKEEILISSVLLQECMNINATIETNFTNYYCYSSSITIHKLRIDMKITLIKTARTTVSRALSCHR